MKTIKFHENLVYYDQPVLFIGRDQFDTNFLCLLVENVTESSFLCLPITSPRLNAFRKGEIDARVVFADSESEDYYLGKLKEGDFNVLEVVYIHKSEVEESWYPDRDVFITDRVHQENLIIEESVDKQRAIIHCSLNPPEAMFESKISTTHLSDGVRLFQRLVKYSYEKSLTNGKNLSRDIRDIISKPINYSLDVFATSPGSFIIHMQTSEKADLLGDLNISRAMDIIDKLNSHIEDPNQVVETISQYGGHLVTAYKDFLWFIDENNTTFSYEWAMPSIKKTIRHEIKPSQAKILYKTLSEKTELGNEQIHLIGRFNKIDEVSGSWRLKTLDEDKVYFGESRVSLAGITIETQSYEVFCDEVLLLEPARNIEKKKWYITSIEPI